VAPQAGCAFCAIVAGGDSHVVLDDEHCVAFLDHRPVFPGHCLLVPRQHFETLVDLPPEQVAPLFLRTRELAAAVEEGMGADGTFVAINNRVSQSVPHVHVHVVPRRKKDGLRGFFWPRLRYGSPEEMKDAQGRISEALKRLVDKRGQDRSSF
jgi:histidine triad (HIT) family protein